jgi:hypothetical protein
MRIRFLTRERVIAVTFPFNSSGLLISGWMNKVNGARRVEAATATTGTPRAAAPITTPLLPGVITSTLPPSNACTLVALDGI